MLRSIVPFAVATLIAAAMPATAEIPNLTWFPDEIVSSAIPHPSSPSGVSVAYTPQWIPWSGRGEWHLVYESQGEIWWCLRDSSGWSVPERLTNDPADSRVPNLAFSEQGLCVVWEDDRTGRPEVWVRIWNGSSWSAETCLTADAVESRRPVVAGSYDGAYVVWEEGQEGSTSVRGRYWNGSSWAPVEVLASGSGSPSTPSISVSEWLPYSVAWVDRRHGESEIYVRRGWYGYWMSEQRVTDLTGNCTRPSLHVEPCCSDYIQSSSLIAFENDASGIGETWVASCMEDEPPYVRQLSTGDARASVLPNAGGYVFTGEWGPWGGLFGRFFVTWTEDGLPGQRQHRVAHFSDPWGSDGQDVVAATGLSWSVVAAIAGSPNAPLMTLRTERIEGVDYLIARPGEILGCSRWEFTGPAGGIILGPEGVPGNTITVVNACENSGPVEGVELDVVFDATLDSHLRWDPTQSHPTLPTQSTGEDGRTTFSIRGGGCWPDGFVSVRNFGVEIMFWRGAKSPDVDGDCAVGPDDLAYVTSRLGTSDFCADLDRSGTVTEADVAIIVETMGDLCTGVSDAVDPSGGGIEVTIGPNPSPDAVVLRLRLPSPGRASVRVADAGGRIVRDFGSVAIPSGAGSIEWDARDDSGRPVPSGAYFLRIVTAGGGVDREILILR